MNVHRFDIIVRSISYNTQKRFLDVFTTPPPSIIEWDCKNNSVRSKYEIKGVWEKEIKSISKIIKMNKKK